MAEPHARVVSIAVVANYPQPQGLNNYFTIPHDFVGQSFGKGLTDSSVAGGIDRGIQLVDGLVWRVHQGFIPMSGVFAGVGWKSELSCDSHLGPLMWPLQHNTLRGVGHLT